MRTHTQLKLMVGDPTSVSLPPGSPIAKNDSQSLLISRGTASPVVVSDENWRIVALNPAAERLLGWSSDNAMGQPCHKVMRGRNRFRNHIPPERFDVGAMVRRHEAIQPFEVDLVVGSGRLIQAACSVIVLREESECRVIHVLTLAQDSNRGVQRSSGAEDIRSRRLSAGVKGAPDYDLSSREYDVLRLLAGGNDCLCISDLLCISLATVRNHIHKILSKMGVHSQVEAVAIAYRDRLI